MIIKEFRIILPYKLEEYPIGQLYATARVSMNETGGGDGVEIIENVPYEKGAEKGQYTHKLYHLEQKVPKFVRYIAPKGSLEVDEEAWNAYPYCKTVITNPRYMKDNFILSVTTKHVDNDRGTIENIHDLTPEQLEKREIIIIDIVNEQHHYGYNEAEDPAMHKSVLANRGPLEKDYIHSHVPIMCAYKLVITEFKWWGLQTRAENLIGNFQRKLFTRTHRQMFVWMDEWFNMTMEDIRQYEEKTKADLVAQRATKEIRGTVEVEEK
ncbi:Phosphatidylinositol transfer protein alpha isoform-like isoform X2 [Oopsacas minuta]|uniref:Phosphatidylinositol transfer protein alpha isoform-like isoform X2 n=1 Tax=Oopsacas minuta TaxID=111878 RepID=A0AAV7JR67_9METZ|nr:Phosphatidylinositol transfer protein alpha isoform-like isoform X2 [Oopsacas minuta]